MYLAQCRAQLLLLLVSQSMQPHRPDMCASCQVSAADRKENNGSNRECQAGAQCITVVND